MASRYGKTTYDEQGHQLELLASSKRSSNKPGRSADDPLDSRSPKGAVGTGHNNRRGIIATLDRGSGKTNDDDKLTPKDVMDALLTIRPRLLLVISNKQDAQDLVTAGKILESEGCFVESIPLDNISSLLVFSENIGDKFAIEAVAQLRVNSREENTESFVKRSLRRMSTAPSTTMTSPLPSIEYKHGVMIVVIFAAAAVTAIGASSIAWTFVAFDGLSFISFLVRSVSQIPIILKGWYRLLYFIVTYPGLLARRKAKKLLQVVLDSILIFLQGLRDGAAESA